MKEFRVGIVGATGMVGQRLITLLEGHPWFTVTTLAASARSAGLAYAEAVEGRWAMSVPIPPRIGEMKVLDAADVDAVAARVDFIFCAVNMKKDEIRALEEAYAKKECPVMSNNSAHRGFPDVPMLIPELNPHHAAVIETQRKRLGTRRGFIAVKGKTFATWPEMEDNVIPYIGGEEEKSEQEPLKVWGRLEDGLIVPAQSPSITTQCIRVPVTDGHLAAVFFSLENKVSKEEILRRWKEFSGEPQTLKLPSAPAQFLRYFEEPDRPQTRLDRDLEGGMGIAMGRLREDTQYDYKFVCLSHNTIRGAAGGNILMAELLAAKGYLD